ncbi:MAG TPA: hypothetical protein GXX76_06300 [Bacteroidales bacterium]|nr:hypothetical protein [Bacteroidales bacterium]
MRLQDFFPYDTVILGLVQVYHGVGMDSFFINQPCIMVKDRIVTTGETYFLFSYDGNQLSTSSIVKLIDSFYYNDQVYLLLADLLTDVVLLRNHSLNKSEDKCQWKLFDVNTLRDILFAKDEMKYPEKNIHTDNDLLNFDYQ